MNASRNVSRTVHHVLSYVRPPVFTANVLRVREVRESRAVDVVSYAPPAPKSARTLASIVNVKRSAARSAACQCAMNPADGYCLVHQKVFWVCPLYLFTLLKLKKDA